MPTKNNTFLSTNENSGCGWCGTSSFRKNKQRTFKQL